MRNLRAWQSECIARALSVFETNAHFFCHATPGAGKTVMVARLAEALLDQGAIDLVLCFSPSIAVATSLAKTFKSVLDKRFDGKIGAVGASYTYQAMGQITDDHWRLLEECRVLVVLDEIHHCAAFDWDGQSFGNSWGKTLLEKVEGKARYTIALSGTPWRSDRSPIALSSHTNGETRTVCDYSYGLERAVREGVCRIPQIVLIDNKQIAIQSSHAGLKYYDSIENSLADNSLTYRDFLHNDNVLEHVLSEAAYRLSELREATPDAGGLIVASSVSHAMRIAHMLGSMGETSTVVTYQTPDAHQRIANFAQGRERWIVSVGMISEGTDIPRLQVCCHLSRIRTELHFRQVLGRVLRTRPGDPPRARAWLYVLAEPTLSEFAHRISEDLPEQQVVFSLPDLEEAIGPAESEPALQSAFKIGSGSVETGAFLFSDARSGDEAAAPATMELEMRGEYWARVVSLFHAVL